MQWYFESCMLSFIEKGKCLYAREIYQLPMYVLALLLNESFLAGSEDGNTLLRCRRSIMQSYKSLLS